MMPTGIADSGSVSASTEQREWDESIHEREKGETLKSDQY
jgi:hypothetical protein